MRTKRAEPIKQYNPRFEEDGYVAGRNYDPDRERAEKKKLQRQLKKETKGAARELRKVRMGPSGLGIRIASMHQVLIIYVLVSSASCFGSRAEDSPTDQHSVQSWTG